MEGNHRSNARSVKLCTVKGWKCRKREKGKEREKEREKLTLSPVRAEIFDSVASRGWWRYLAPFQQCVHTFYLAINSRAASDASIVLDNFLDRSFATEHAIISLPCETRRSFHFFLLRDGSRFRYGAEPGNWKKQISILCNFSVLKKRLNEDTNEILSIRT